MKRLTTKYLDYLTDDFSVWQHTTGSDIDRKYGYSLDDAARSLLVAIDFKDAEKIKTYLNFLSKAITPNRIVNFFDQNRQPLPLPWSEDAVGEAYWAVAICLGQKMFEDICASLCEIMIPYIMNFKSIRGKAYVMLGAVEVLDIDLLFVFANFLLKQYKNHAHADWGWLEDDLRYGNAIIPYSLLKASRALSDWPMERSALSMLDFLNSETVLGGVPMTIGNRGWFSRHGKKAIFDQQPIDPAYQVIANVEAYEMTGDQKYLVEAKRYLSWFWGNNILNTPLINVEMEGCYDGLMEQGLKKNQGSENIVCYLLAQEAIWKYLDDVKED